jgi:hypothetical protein
VRYPPGLCTPHPPGLCIPRPPGLCTLQPTGVYTLTPCLCNPRSLNPLVFVSLTPCSCTPHPPGLCTPQFPDLCPPHLPGLAFLLLNDLTPGLSMISPLAFQRGLAAVSVVGARAIYEG